MKTYASVAVLLCMALMLAGCGSTEPAAPAPAPSPDVPAVELPDEPSAPPPAPAFEDELDEPPMTPLEPAVRPELSEPSGLVEPAPDEPSMDDSATTDGENSSVTRAFGTALLKGFREGAAGNP